MPTMKLSEPDLRAYADGAADRGGVPRDLFRKQIQQESGFDPDAYNASSGASGIAQIVPRFHPDVDPHDPLASLDYAAGWMASMHRQYGNYARALAAYNWGPGNVQNWNGRRDSLPAETQHYLDVIMGPGWPEPTPIGEDTGGMNTPVNIPQLRVTDDGVRLREQPSTSSTVLATLPAGTLVTPTSDHAWRPVTYGDQAGYIAEELLAPAETVHHSPGMLAFNPNFPTQLQRQQWTCSIRSTMMLLDSIGIAVTAEEAQDAMSPQYVNSDVGLLDASGAGIVQVLADRWGVAAQNYSPCTFDDVAALAGQMPVALGLRNWGMPGGHWSAVRGFDGERLILANPGGTGPRYGQQTLTRDEFNARGPASAVFIPIA